MTCQKEADRVSTLATTTIQAYTRGYLARSSRESWAWVAEAVPTLASITIQACARGYLSRRRKSRLPQRICASWSWVTKAVEDSGYSSCLVPPRMTNGKADSKESVPPKESKCGLTAEWKDNCDTTVESVEEKVPCV